MKNIACFINQSRQGARISAILCCTGLLGASTLLAGSDTAPDGKSAAQPAQEDTDYSNWVNLTLGGMVLGGDQAQFRQQNHTSSGPVFGGIEDMHYEKTLGKNTQLTIDGHAIFDNSDYKIKLGLSKPDLGYINAGYTQFRTWSDDNGGYIQSTGQFFPGLNNNDMALDHGDIWVEIGLRDPNLPEMTVRYDHDYRYGQESSTEWGTVYVGTPTAAGTNQRKAYPSFWDINETRDILSFDATKTVFGNTDLTLGMRYEYNRNNDTFNEDNLTYRATSPGLQYNAYTSQVNDLDLNLFDGHYSSVTRLNDNFWFTTGYCYTAMDSNTGATRLTGTTGSLTAFDPLHPLAGFTMANGASVSQEQIINLSLMWVPIKDLTIIPAVRIGVENINSNSPYISTGTSVAISGTNYVATSSNHYNDVEESLDIRYTGIDNILLYFRGNWDEQTGDYDQTQTIGTNINGGTVTVVRHAPFSPLVLPVTGFNSVSQAANNTYLSQKYALGANWYPLTHLNLAVQYYFQDEQSNYLWTPQTILSGTVINSIANAGKNMGVISAEDLVTNDVNARVTWRPINSLALVTRYDMQYITMYNSGIGSSTTPSSYLPGTQSANIANNMFTECITWNPLPRLYVEGNGSLVFSQTDTPAAAINLTGGTPSQHTPSVLNFSNNYYEVSCDVGFIIDDKTDLHADYTFYRACNYDNNISAGMPYGAGAIENTVSVGIVRKITKNISASLKYSYISYYDQTSGSNDSYTANMIYSGLQFRF